MIRRTLVALSAVLGFTLSASPSDAAVSWNLKPSGTGDWDWNLRGVYQWYDRIENDKVFSSFQGITWARTTGNMAPHCIELSTGPGRFVGNPDTRIWARTYEGAWFSINDDSNGTLQSRARLWISFPSAGQYFAKVAPWNDANGRFDDFELIVTRRDLSESACTTGQTSIPWAKFKQTSGFAYALTISPNAT
jgi:hypothetical protein